MRNILVTGSLAYDRIAVFNGRFQDHILPHKIHELSVVFSVEDLTVNYGGTAGNIAYNLKLLGDEPIISGYLGSDGQGYLDYFDVLSLETTYIQKSSDQLTATATIMTDIESNQITSFYVGAMAESKNLNLNAIQQEIEMAIIAPNENQAMLAVRTFCLEKRIPFIADPGQRIGVFTDDELRTFITNSFALVVNDYEFELVSKKTGWKEGGLLENTQYLIVTNGEEGSKIYQKDASPISIPAYSIKQVVDPTGAGDAYRAGLLAGLKQGLSIEKAAHLGSWLAAKCVEEKGTQNHKIMQKEWKILLETLY